MLSVYAFNGFRSVRYNFEHFIKDISEFQLKSFYYTLNDVEIGLQDWLKNLIRVVLMLLPEGCAPPIILYVDDTMVEEGGQN